MKTYHDASVETESFWWPPEGTGHTAAGRSQGASEVHDRAVRDAADIAGVESCCHLGHDLVDILHNGLDGVVDPNIFHMFLPVAFAIMDVDIGKQCTTAVAPRRKSFATGKLRWR